MAISLVPISLGLLFSFLRALLVDPRSLFALRALIVFGISFGLMIIFLGFGFGGLWKRRIYGYWLALIFLGAAIVASILQLAPKLYALAAGGSVESTYLVQGNRSEALIIFDLVVQSVMLGLVVLLFLKLSFGEHEKLFFSADRG
jgi:hypothetical protein